MANCKVCGTLLQTATSQDLCPTCEMALKRLAGYAIPIDYFQVKTVVIRKPHRFMSTNRFSNFVHATFPKDWCVGWADPNCNSYLLTIPTLKENKNG